MIRRVAFDLTGLPPTLEETRIFVEDRKPDAYARMIERYLKSDRYGERWGKFWLDVAGYADSDGYFIDFDQERPLACFVFDFQFQTCSMGNHAAHFVPSAFCVFHRFFACCQRKTGPDCDFGNFT